MNHLPSNIGQSIQVQLRPSGDDFDPANHNHNFHSYPAVAGWNYDERESTLVINKKFTGVPIPFDAFLQSWLFFGLIATVARTDQPFKATDFTEKGIGNYVHTKTLNEHLKKWKESELSKKDGLFDRMIRAEAALVKARRVVLKYCSYDTEKELPWSHPYFIDSEIALSLMVLGETLAAAKEKIVKQADLPHIRGWYGDANEGWGTPRCIIKRMKDDKWCKRTVQTLRGQLRNHATSFLAAWAAHQQAHIHFRGHEFCTENECNSKSENEGKKYQTKHHDIYCTGSNCRQLGPKIQDLVNILDNDNFPLLTLKVSGQGKAVSVDDVKAIDYMPHTTYATFSHIWSDGYGNETANELWQCQLRFFYELLQNGKLKQDIPFYIDTLAVPVGEAHKPQRKKAIRKINEVFHHAAYTIVIDSGLSNMQPGDGYELLAMKILASGWMRRLWTLEEAYLSDRLMINFDKIQLLDVDNDVEGGYGKAGDSLSSNVADVAQSYFHNILGPQRRKRRANLDQHGNFVPTGGVEGVGLLASVWQASRWRTTTHSKHETLALATLLNLTNYSDMIAEAGLVPNETEVTPEVEDPAVRKRMEQEKARAAERSLEDMMIELWNELSRHVSEGIIPPSIIFVPGKRLSMPGFGWAPKTWMVGHGDEGAYPDPARIPGRPARLMQAVGNQGGGLLVKFRGFILHARNRNVILELNKDEFTFPSDNTLLDWYTVNLKVDATEENPTSRRQEKQLAIILSGPQPREIPEIALLVELNEPKWRNTPTWYVSIIRRVLVRRETRKSLTNENYIIDSEGKEDSLIYGEVVDDNQEWCVDGRRKPPVPVPDIPLSTQQTAVAEPASSLTDRARKLPMLITSTSSGWWNSLRLSAPSSSESSAPDQRLGVEGTSLARATTSLEDPKPQVKRTLTGWLLRGSPNL